MVRAGLFGQIVHVHCAHCHDASNTGSSSQGTIDGREYLIRYIGTSTRHTASAVLSWCDINCGDRFTSITSTRRQFRESTRFSPVFWAGHPGPPQYAQGHRDVHVKTAGGKTVLSTTTCRCTRPYDNRWMRQGTRGVYTSSATPCTLSTRDGNTQWSRSRPFRKSTAPWWKQGGHGAHGGVVGLELRLLVRRFARRRRCPWMSTIRWS